MTDLMPQVGDVALVWWNTGTKAPEWAGNYYLATVRAVKPYRGTFDFISCIVELDPSVTSTTGKPTEAAVEKNNPRFLLRTHPCRLT